MTTLGVSCIMFLANVCMHNVSAIEIHDSGLSAYATVHGEKFVAQINYQSDNFGTPDWDKMNDACANGVCIAYFKTCIASDRQQVCTYEFSQPGDVQNTTIRITADSAVMSNSEMAFGILARSGWDLTEIPLSTFTVISDPKNEPSCPMWRPRSSCWPKHQTSGRP